MSAAEAEVITPEQEPQKKPRSRAITQAQSSDVLPGTLVEVAEKDLAIVRHEETLPVPANDSQMLQSLMTEAIRSGNRELMREVMEIRRELKAEAAREAFFAALSVFQAECPIIKRKKAVYEKDRTKGVRYHYAPLDDIVRIVGPLLTKHGLSYKIESRVEVREKIEWLLVECIVHHELGHKEKSPPFEVPLMFSDFMNKQQSFGAATTFAKRYAILDALGIVTGDDDNDARGVSASANDGRAVRQPVSQPRQTPTAQRAEAQKANGGSTRVDLEPAGEGEAIDANTVSGLGKAMEHAGLSLSDFTARFPKLGGPEQIKKTDMRAIMSWIADPKKN